ncbi:OmpA family protein [Extensimonas sp. H3M7-6]|uniref:OmpA family protein n=1 Tax=Extensimonas soli TaxID=3031322 RepID=UPI0023DB4A41|nr:OmpA family protein [Extensimonas sp. H3M7-6]MDF1481110.1 OmpA family protein [Extensimonas sp. H3M7-6]
MSLANWYRRLAGGAAVALLAGLCGCSTNPDRIILLPDPEGRVGAVIVHSASGERVLDKAYAEVGVGKGGAMETTQESQAGVQQRYGELLAARPPRPMSFTVHFLFDSATEVAPESLAMLETIKTVLANWPAPQLVVVGHTDRAGSVESNDKLSLRRAESVKALLIKSGIPAQQIETAGRGEREPLVVTADGIPNLQNRRVVITVQ